MFCQFGALNSSLEQSSRSIHESFIEQELSDVKQKSTSGGLSSREQDQARAIQLQKDAFNAQVEGRTSDQGSKVILNYWLKNIGIVGVFVIKRNGFIQNEVKVAFFR